MQSAQQQQQQSHSKQEQNHSYDPRRPATHIEDRLDAVAPILKADGNPSKTEQFETTLISKFNFHSKFC